MIEHFTDAFVLDLEDAGELDGLVYLYTKELGKVVARAKSIKKITSKLAGHLQPLNIARVRLVEKRNFQIVDALALNKLKPTSEALEFFHFLKDMTFELQTDKGLWMTVRKAFQDFKSGNKISYRPILKVLGFDPDFADCSSCGNKKVIYFYKEDQLFFCQKCGFKIPKNGVILIT